MDANTYLAMFYRPDVPQMVQWRGIAWMHEPHGDWRIYLEYGE